MRTTLEIDADVMVAALEIAYRQQRSLGSVISDLARRGLDQARVETQGHMPVVQVPEGAPRITPEMVRRALNED